MTAYVISVGKGDSTEALHDIYRKNLEGVLQELKTAAESFGKGSFKKVSKVTPKKITYSDCDLTKKFIQDGLKEDTVHLAYGPKGKIHFWVNINTVDIS